MYANNKQQKNIVMSFKLIQKKLGRKKLEFVRSGSGSRTGPGSGSGSGSIIPEADPQIRIRIKMIRIQNTDRKYLNKKLEFVRVVGVGSVIPEADPHQNEADSFSTIL